MFRGDTKLQEDHDRIGLEVLTCIEAENVKISLIIFVEFSEKKRKRKLN